jgi:hypothetical protein
MAKLQQLLLLWSPLLSLLGVVFGFISVYLARRSLRDSGLLVSQIDAINTELKEAERDYRRNIDEFLQFMGVRGYLSVALELYRSATRRVVSVTRIWFVSSEMEVALIRLISLESLEVDFCGPVTLLDPSFPPLLWRLHLVHVREKADPKRVRLWAATEIPVRFTVSDDTVLIAGAPLERIPHETVSWQTEKEKPAADFYAKLFVTQLQPVWQPAELALLAELRTRYSGQLPLDTLVNDLVTVVYHDRYEPNANRTTWGRKIEKPEFEDTLREWLVSLHARYPAKVEIANGNIAFR